jgi:hypothetical protein
MESFSNGFGMVLVLWLLCMMVSPPLITKSSKVDSCCRCCSVTNDFCNRTSLMTQVSSLTTNLCHNSGYLVRNVLNANHAPIRTCCDGSSRP